MSKITVRARTGFTIPKSVTGEKKDRRVAAGETVSVPKLYGDHLVHDGFADTGADGDADEAGEGVVDLARLNKEKLLAEAARRGVAVDPEKTKADIIAAIEAAAAA